MAFKMKGPSLYKDLSVNRNGYKNASDGKSKSAPFQNYENPQDYKVFNMGNKPTPIKQTDKDLKNYLLDEKGFNQADADRMIKDGAYTISDKGFLAWYKGKDEPAEPKGGKEDVMEEGRTSPMKLTSAKKAENLAKHAEKGKNDPNYWKKVKEVTGADKAKYKGKQY